MTAADYQAILSRAVADTARYRVLTVQAATPHTTPTKENR
jgi:hypothetical protein